MVRKVQTLIEPFPGHAQFVREHSPEVLEQAFQHDPALKALLEEYRLSYQNGRWLVSMLDGLRGEHRKALAGYKTPTLYLSKKERLQFVPQIHGGKLHLPDGKPILSKRVDFVMDSEGRFYLFDPFAPGPRQAIHHSSFTEGGPVGAAGTLYFNAEGMLTAITPESGHYLPPLTFCEQARQGLANLGVNIERTRIVSKSEVDRLPNPTRVLTQ